jgi:hypothetical protein
VRALARSGNALAVVALAFIALRWWYFPSASLNYKLSVDIEDNGVLHHGEGVIGVDFQSNGFALIDNTPHWSIGARGEAFSIDLGERGALFALLSSDPTRASPSRPREHTSAAAGRSAMWAYCGDSFGDLPPNQSGKRRLDEFKRDRAVVEIALDSLPMLVRFRDLNDPTSVVRVDPDHLDASFGAGVTLVRATVQITDEPVTTGLEKTLGWLTDGYREKPLSEPHGGRPDRLPSSQTLTYGDFWSMPK